jgi:predicted NBD/HSP70 family sugar kinase
MSPATPTPRRVVVGVDNGGTSNNVTVLSDDGRFLVDSMLEVPSRVLDGPAPAIAAMVEAFHLGLQHTGCAVGDVVAVGLDTPGPASAEGVLSSRGAANFSDAAWWSFDIRGALEDALQLPVLYSNDGNAAALYAHHAHFGQLALDRSSVSAIVGTGLGGGVIEGGRIIRGAAGMAGELGHVHIPMDGVLEPDQPAPRCNCGFVNDVESVASLTAIRQNLLPYWLGRYPDHPLHGVDATVASKQVRGLAEHGDELALRIFGQQAAALGRLCTIAANFTDPHAFFIGGGVVEASPAFRDWFVDEIRRNTTLREEQQRIVEFAVVPDRDMAGARGAALAAMGRFG